MGTLANSILLRNLFWGNICDRLEGRSSPDIRGLSSDLLRSKRAEIKMNPLFYWVILPIYNSASYIFVEFYFKKKCMFFTCYLWSWWKSNFLPFRWSGALVVPAGRQGQPLLWKSAYTDIIKCNTVIFKQLQTCSCQLQNCSGARTASFPHVHQNSCSCSETFFFQSAHLVGFQVEYRQRAQSKQTERQKQIAQTVPAWWSHPGGPEKRHIIHKWKKEERKGIKMTKCKIHVSQLLHLSQEN